MPLFMDRHNITDLGAETIAEMHQRDLAIQDRFGVRALTYWFDEIRGATFCLLEAPDEESIRTLHHHAHGDVPTEIVPVDPSTVELFLGRLTDPKSSEPGAPITDSAFRAIMFTDMVDSTGLTRRLGDSAATELLRGHDEAIRRCLAEHDGREVKHTGDGIMACFRSVVRAVECAIAVHRALDHFNGGRAGEPVAVRIGLTAGEPVQRDNDLFGAAVQQAARVCGVAEPRGIAVTRVVRDLCVGKRLPFRERAPVTLKGFEEPETLFDVPWAESEA